MTDFSLFQKAISNDLKPFPETTSGEGIFKSFRWSLILHCALIVFLFVSSFLFQSSVSRYQPTLRVDVVELPDLLKKDLNKVGIPEPEPEPKKEKKPAPEVKKESKPKPNEMALKKKKKRAKKKRKRKMQSALDRIKALDKIKGEVQAEKIKGNRISKGTALTGDARESMERTYYDDLLERVRIHWALPPWLARQGLSAKVKIYIDPRGRIRGMRFLQRSGNAQYDAEVKDAITDTDPFPPPPAALKEEVLRDGVILAFPL